MVKKNICVLFLILSFFFGQDAFSNELRLGFDGLADLAANVDSFGVTFTGATVLACGGSLNCVEGMRRNFSFTFLLKCACYIGDRLQLIKQNIPFRNSFDISSSS